MSRTSRDRFDLIRQDGYTPISFFFSSWNVFFSFCIFAFLFFSFSTSFCYCCLMDFQMRAVINVGSLWEFPPSGISSSRLYIFEPIVLLWRVQKVYHRSDWIHLLQNRRRSISNCIFILELVYRVRGGNSF